MFVNEVKDKYLALAQVIKYASKREEVRIFTNNNVYRGFITRIHFNESFTVGEPQIILDIETSQQMEVTRYLKDIVAILPADTGDVMVVALNSSPLPTPIPF